MFRIVKDLLTAITAQIARKHCKRVQLKKKTCATCIYVCESYSVSYLSRNSNGMESKGTFDSYDLAKSTRLYGNKMQHIFNRIVCCIDCFTLVYVMEYELVR